MFKFQQKIQIMKVSEMLNWEKNVHIICIIKVHNKCFKRKIHTMRGFNPEVYLNAVVYLLFDYMYEEV